MATPHTGITDPKRTTWIRCDVTDDQGGWRYSAQLRKADGAALPEVLLRDENSATSGFWLSVASFRRMVQAVEKMISEAAAPAESGGHHE